MECDVWYWISALHLYETLYIFLARIRRETSVRNTFVAQRSVRSFISETLLRPFQLHWSSCVTSGQCYCPCVSIKRSQRICRVGFRGCEVVKNLPSLTDAMIRLGAIDALCMIFFKVLSRWLSECLALLSIFRRCSRFFHSGLHVSSSWRPCRSHEHLELLRHQINFHAIFPRLKSHIKLRFYPLWTFTKERFWFSTSWNAFQTSIFSFHDMTIKESQHIAQTQFSFVFSIFIDVCWIVTIAPYSKSVFSFPIQSADSFLSTFLECSMRFHVLRVELCDFIENFFKIISREFVGFPMHSFSPRCNSFLQGAHAICVDCDLHVSEIFSMSSGTLSFRVGE